MKQLILILAFFSLIGCAAVTTVLDAVYPPDPVCDQNTPAKAYWDGRICVYDLGAGYWRWVDVRKGD